MESFFFFLVSSVIIIVMFWGLWMIYGERIKAWFGRNTK